MRGYGTIHSDGSAGSRRRPRALGRLRRAGFSLVELMCVVSITGVLTAVAKGPTDRILTHTRVNRAASILVGDLETAQSLAARTRRPVRVAYDATNNVVTVSDRAGSTVYLRRRLGKTDDYRLSTVQFSASSVDFFPSGLASGPLRISVGGGGAGVTGGEYSRVITMTRAGLLRVVPL